MKRFCRLITGLLLAAVLMQPVLSAPRCSDWFISELSELSAAALLPSSLNDADLTQPTTRLELCQMAAAFWQALYGSLPSGGTSPFIDVDDPAVTACYQLGLVGGYGEGIFAPNDPLTRQQMFCVVYQMMQCMGAAPQGDMALLSGYADGALVAEWAQLPAAALLAQGIVHGSDGLLLPEQTLTREQTLAMLWRGWQSAAAQADWNEIYSDASDTLDGSQADEPQPGQEQTDSALGSADESYEEKYTRIFGSPDAAKYATEAEAKAHMVTITVPVWNFNTDHVKVQTSRTLVVHEAIADTVMAIFTEIYNGPERFPIYSVGGYSWRGDGTSEHNWGIAIDINPDENYYVYHGVPTVGSHWTPGEDPYSIPEDGDVVRAFAKYGFAWGGNAWRYTQDYMHFSYFGN